MATPKQAVPVVSAHDAPPMKSSSDRKKSLTALHAALKLVARAIDQLQVHHFTNVRKVLTDQLGPHIRLGAADMLTLKQRVATLGTSYCDLEKYLTHWALAGKDGTILDDAQHRTVITQAEALRDAVLTARVDLVELLERVKREQGCTGGDTAADMEKEEVGRYLVRGLGTLVGTCVVGGRWLHVFLSVHVTP